MTCSRCATINPDGAQICAACGAPLVMGAAPPPPGAYMPQPGQMPPGAMPYGYGMAPPQRSGIPKVMGILMIIFASLGILGSLASFGGPSGGDAFKGMEEWDRLVTMTKLFAGVDLIVGILHLFAGVRLVGYKKNGPSLAFTYGIVRIIVVIGELVMMYAWIKPALDKVAPEASALVGGMFVIGAVFGCIWPILVLALTTRPNAKASCLG